MPFGDPDGPADRRLGRVRRADPARMPVHAAFCLGDNNGTPRCAPDQAAEGRRRWSSSGHGTVAARVCAGSSSAARGKVTVTCSGPGCRRRPRSPWPGLAGMIHGLEQTVYRAGDRLRVTISAGRCRSAGYASGMGASRSCGRCNRSAGPGAGKLTRIRSGRSIGAFPGHSQCGLRRDRVVRRLPWRSQARADDATDVANNLGQSGGHPPRGETDGWGNGRSVRIGRPPRPSTWATTTGSGQMSRSATGDDPVTGDWNGSGKTQIGAWRPSDATCACGLRQTGSRTWPCIGAGGRHPHHRGTGTARAGRGWGWSPQATRGVTCAPRSGNSPC